MLPPVEPFCENVSRLLGRFFAQNGQTAVTAATQEEFARRLHALVGERGLPPPLRPGERGEPREMSKEEVAPLIDRLLAGFAAAEQAALATPARQLVKACFCPPFLTCRDSFREISADGSCRRQELKRVRERVSGSHCVDCPYWTSLTPAQHAKFLAKEWRVSGAAEFAAHQSIYLPEDFRQLREILQTESSHDRS